MGSNFNLLAGMGYYTLRIMSYLGVLLNLYIIPNHEWFLLLNTNENGFRFYTLLLELPTYLKFVLFYDIEDVSQYFRLLFYQLQLTRTKNN